VDRLFLNFIAILDAGFAIHNKEKNAKILLKLCHAI
jgi:hypothetical protein